MSFYPEYIEINNVDYKIDTDYRTAIQCLEISADESISDEERALAIVYLLYGFVPEENIELFLEKAKLFLEGGRDDSVSNKTEPDMDFSQDFRYIIASFWSDYGKDLSSNQPLHFWLFLDLIDGLTESSILNRVRYIRSVKLSDISDQKEKDRLAKAKETVKLRKKIKKMSPEQSENQKRCYELLGLKVGD